jgi:hypothetical protein
MASAGMESLRFPQQLSIHNKSAYIEKTLASNATKYLLTHVHQTWNSASYFYHNSQYSYDPNQFSEELIVFPIVLLYQVSPPMDRAYSTKYSMQPLSMSPPVYMTLYKTTRV